MNFNEANDDNRDYLKNGDIVNNRYKIIERLGEGRFGETYKAEDEQKFNEIVAVKRLKLESFREQDLPKAKELFEREAKTLLKLKSSPLIPNLEAYSIEEDKKFYLVMEYIDGSSLEEELKSKLGEKK